MKTVTKVFLIIQILAMVITALMGFIFAIVGIITINTPLEDSNITVNDQPITDETVIKSFGVIFLVIGLLMLIFSIVSLLISIVAIKKLNTAKKANDISTGFKIVVLLLSNIISGILLLCMGDNDYYPQLVPVYPTQQQNSNVDQIAKLKKLLDMGAITQEEFEYNKSKIIGANETAQENTL